MAPADQPVHFLDRVHRSANGAGAVGIVLEVRREDRFQHELGGGLDYPIPDRRNAERSLASVRLRYRYPPHRIGPVRLRNQFLPQARQPLLQAPLRRIAQPPKAAFVTRLQPCRLPDRTARQLPDQSTTLWVESSSTSDPRLRGALPARDLCTAA